MHEMKLETNRLMDPSMSPYHSGEIKNTKKIGKKVALSYIVFAQSITTHATVL